MPEVTQPVSEEIRVEALLSHSMAPALDALWGIKSSQGGRVGRGDLEIWILSNKGKKMFHGC